jgi:1,4-dihydroxy-2-naphthoyl-CoA hydrolase
MSGGPTADDLNRAGAGKLPELIGIEVTAAEPGRAAGRLPVREALLAPNGFLHAASIIALVDTLAGYGVMASLPEGASGFTTVELKSNFMGTARDGVVLGEAVMVHGGRTTQVWDARAWREDDSRAIALFRCTQMILYPR